LTAAENDLEHHLDAISESQWREIKAHNQQRYDQVMSRERGADYV
jgi:hypothetical protein